MLLQLDNKTNHGASKFAIQSLAVSKITDDTEAKSCVVCLTDMAKGEKIKILPCTHIFHIKCIDKWLKVNKLCPICKRNIEEPVSNTTTTSSE